MRHLNTLDTMLSECQHLLENVFTRSTTATRPNPGTLRLEHPLQPEEIRQSQGFMRVNHTGEICAQALYRGQAFASHDPEIKAYLQDAAHEEADHLAWCQERLNELGTHSSRLNLFWYAASFLLGFTAAKKSDQISLGFVEETEKQVVRHLEHHAQYLSPQDHKSRAIVAVMREDENKHSETAHAKGALELPDLVKLLMKLQAKFMTSTAYYL